MIKTSAIWKNERGAIMILVTLMFLTLLTVISIAASRTANTEIKIASNDYAHQRCFYNAEGAIMEAVDQLETKVTPKGNPPAWMGSDEVAVNDGTVFTYWEDDSETKDAIPEGAQIDPNAAAYLAVHHGIQPGDTLDVSKPTKHTFSIYGRCEKNGLVMLKVGYANTYK